jgi:acyl-CoA reductase-like NAD-dependent aldehyde dehydrogenase
MGFELKYNNYLNGEWRGSASTDRFEVANPADLRQICHTYPRSVPEDVALAIEGARRAFASWSSVSLGEKAVYINKGNG